MLKAKDRRGFAHPVILLLIIASVAVIGGGYFAVQKANQAAKSNLTGTTATSPAASASGTSSGTVQGTVSPAPSPTSTPVKKSSSPSPSAKVTPTPKPGTAGTSGVEGYAEIGPTQPVCRVGTPCSAPAKESYPITVTNTSTGKVVYSGNSNSDGTFTIQLAPGSYTLQATRQQSIQSTSTQQAVVTTGKYSTVVFQFDTGIR